MTDRRNIRKMTIADWGHLYDGDAHAQGWSIFNTCGAQGHDEYEIEALEEEGKFPGDDEAMLFVVDNARAGDHASRAAIAALFNDGCHQALAEALLCYLDIDTSTGWFAEDDDAPSEPAVPPSSMPEAHARFAPNITLYAESRIDPVFGITVYTNAEADRPYRFMELANGERHWNARIVVGRRADGVLPYAFEARIDGINNLGNNLLFVEIDDTTDDANAFGSQRKLPIAWIDAIFIY